MKSAANQIVIRIVVAFLFMLASGWNLMSFLKEIFQNAWQGNFNTAEPPLMWLGIVLGLVGIVIFIQAGVSWDRMQDAEATDQRS
jgi:hypothetical protein